MCLNKGLLSLLFCTWLLSFGVASKPLLVAVDNSPPYSFVDSEGAYQGLSVTLAHWLAAALETEAEFVLCPWARCLQLVADGQADVLVGLSKTPERTTRFHFVEPAFFRGSQDFVFYLIRDEIHIRQYEDVLPLIIGTLRGSKHYPLFDNDTRITKAEATNTESLINMLHRGHVDAILHLESTMQPLLQTLDPHRRIRRSAFRHRLDMSGYVVMSLRSPWYPHRGLVEKVLQQKLEQGKVSALFKAYGIAQPDP